MHLILFDSFRVLHTEVYAHLLYHTLYVRAVLPTDQYKAHVFQVRVIYLCEFFVLFYLSVVFKCSVSTQYTANVTFVSESLLTMKKSV